MSDLRLSDLAATEPQAPPPGHRPGATYDRLARWYDLLAGRWEESAKRKALDLLRAHVGERVLDVGCGTGREVAALGPGGRLCVVALSRAGGQNLLRRLYQWGHERFPALLDCRPIFARDALQRAGFVVGEWRLASVGTLPVEITLARAG